MRILQVIHDFLPHHAAGSELYTFYLAKELQKRHSVYVMFTEVDHAKAQYHYRRSSYQGLPYYEVVHNHLYRRFEDTYADARMDRAFSRILDEVHPDVVHLQHLLNHSLGYIAIAKQRGIPVVFTLHDYWLSCFNGGQRIRPDLSICDEVDVTLCAECARRFGGGAYLASTLASKVLGIAGRKGEGSLLDRLASARIDAPKNFVRLDQFNLGGEPRPVLIAHPPARVEFALDARAGTRLDFAVAMAPSTFTKPGGGVTFEIHGPEGILWSRSLDPKARPEDRRWVEDGVILPASGDGRVTLSLVTRSQPTADNQHCTAGWAGLRLEMPPAAEQERLAPAKALFRAVERFLSTESESKRAARVERRLARVREACRDVDLFLAPSPFLRRKMIEFGLPAERVVESDYGMRADLLQPFRRKASNVVRFGYIGSLVPHKGIHVLVDAFRKVALNGASGRAVLKVHGNPSWYPDYAAKLRAAAAGLPIDFLGEFDNQGAAEIFAGLDVLVVPSVWWENAPITIHEAILTGTPVIASNLGGMADFVRHGENGLLFKAGDADDLASQIDWLVEDPSRLDLLRQPAVTIKTMGQDAADMEQRYLELIGAPAVSGRSEAGALVAGKTKR
jgi:glycosyltransferase involved in cell wall biosynthesis